MVNSTNLIGQKFGNYYLRSLLGQGSFGGVYLAEHIYLHTPAAIKVLLNTQLAQGESERFYTEARIIEQLDHPHIVRMKDFGLERNTPYLVMTYAPHGTLLSKVPTGTALPLPVVISCVKQIADALQYAHDHNVVHRDVKPANVLLNDKDELLLSDFGIARIVEGTSEPGTRSVGTMAYIAPEQLQGRPGPASDQYALAIMSYEWLTGVRPFQGNQAELVGQHLSAPPPSLRQRMPSIPPAVEQVVLRALAKNPQQRFPSVRAFADALEQASRGDQSTILPSWPSQAPTYPANAPAGAGSGSALHLPPVSQPVPSYLPTTPADRSGGYIPQADRSSGYVPPPPPASGYAPPAPPPVYVMLPPSYAPPYQPPAPPPAQPRKRSRSRSCLATLIILVIVFGICAVSYNALYNALKAHNTTSSTSATTVPTPLTVTKYTLYSANWSKNLGGWHGSSEWKWIQSGIIGSASSDNYFNLDINQYSLFAPYYPKTADYIVEAQIQYVRFSASYNGVFGILVRAGNGTGYVVGFSQSSGAVIDSEGSNTISNINSSFSAQPDTAYQTYRVEVKSNIITFYINGQQVLQTTDNSYLSAGSVGLMASGAVIDVHSFQVEKT